MSNALWLISIQCGRFCATGAKVKL